MPPALNSVPESPDGRARATSATSTTMGPPPLPQNPSSPSSPRVLNVHPTNDHHGGAGAGPGPLRHPRPLTAAELYLELEKEQEGIVNRLTRELSALRAQTASVASTTSSNPDLLDHSVIVPTSARRHRSSSNLSNRSNRSINAPNTTGSTSVSGVAARRETSVPNSTRPSVDLSRPDFSRHDSGAGRRSVTASPSLTSIPFSNHGHSAPIQRQPTAAQMSNNVPAVDPYVPHTQSPSFSTAVATARYEEAAFHKAEMDAVKRENEMLRQKIKELEKLIGERSRGGGSGDLTRRTSSGGGHAG